MKKIRLRLAFCLNGCNVLGKKSPLLISGSGLSRPMKKLDLSKMNE